MKLANYLLLAILALALISSCSSNTRKPTEPALPGFGNLDRIPIGVSDRFPDGTPSEGCGIMGLFTLDIDADNAGATLNPIRINSSTDTFEVVDITNFLTMAPCTNCAKIKSVSIDSNNNVVVTIGIKHPFPTGDPFKPITGRNRADLHVFNVEGVLASQGTESINFPTLGMTIDTPNLVNASGYTSYLDNKLDSEVFQTDANVHPYILHFADYSAGNFDPSNAMGFASVTDPPPNGNLVMAMGCDYDYRDYVFDLSGGDIVYTYAIECTYGVSSSSKSQRFAPVYRIPQHLKKAASEIHTLLSGKLKQEQPTEPITLSVQVVDPSHGIAVGDEIDHMYKDSSVGSVIVEIPGILTDTKTQPGSAAISGSGHNPSDPLLYEFTISNEQSAPIGFYSGLVKVIDTYPPHSNIAPSSNGMDAIKRVDPLVNPNTGLFDLEEFATYAVFQVEVELGYVGHDPVPDLKRSVPLCAPSQVTLDASGSTDEEDDPQGIPLNFEFDYTYDGTTFNVDRAMSNDPIAVATYDTAGCYTAAVRVTDSDNNQVIGTIIVPVGDFSPTNTEADVTDGFSITEIDFEHSAPTFAPDVGWPGMTLPVKGSARGDGYIYTAFYGVQGVDKRIFFSRSNDDGQTWDMPVVVHTYDALGEYSGCSIGADNTGQVIVVWSDRLHRSVGMEYSTDNGTTFNSTILRDEDDIANWVDTYRTPDVAIDPLNPDNIIVAVMYIHYGNGWFMGWDQMYVFYSSTGSSGAFNEVFHVASDEWHPSWVANVYKIYAHYAIDGDAYVIAGENNNIFVYRSSDSGATWADDPEHHMINTIDVWHRDFDSAMDPNNPEVFYVTCIRRNPTIYPVEVYKSTDGLTVTMIQDHINDNISSSYYRFCPSITVNDAGVVYIMWETNESGSFDIMADYSCDGGVTFNTDVQFNTVNDGDEIDPDLIPNSCGDGVICIWEQNGRSANGKLVARLG